MSSDKKQALNGHQRFSLNVELKIYLLEKNEPFETYEKAGEWFAKFLNFTPTRNNIRTACKDIGVLPNKVVNDRCGSYGGQVTSCIRRLNDLQARVEELEKLLK